MRGFLDFSCSSLHFFDRPGRPQRTSPQRRGDLRGGAWHHVEDLKRLWLKRLEPKAKAKAGQEQGQYQSCPDGV